MAKTQVNTTHPTKGQRFKRFIIKAIGEVLLLVIGILIALKINNMNNDHQLRQKIRATFSQVENELNESIATADEFIEIYNEQKELTADFMAGKFTAEDFSKPENADLNSLGLNFNKMIIKTNGFDKLKNYSEGLTTKELKKYAKLQELYIGSKDHIDGLNYQIEEHVVGVVVRLSEKQPWFANYIYKGDYSKEALSYFANDPQHKNDVALYSLLAHGNHLRFIQYFKIEAEKCLKLVRGMKR